jgi:hypothetical protein
MRPAQARQPARRQLHGCLKTRTCYNEATAGPHHETSSPLDIQAPGMSFELCKSRIAGLDMRKRFSEA